MRGPGSFSQSGQEARVRPFPGRQPYTENAHTTITQTNQERVSPSSRTRRLNLPKHNLQKPLSGKGFSSKSSCRLSFFLFSRVGEACELWLQGWMGLAGSGLSCKPQPLSRVPWKRALSPRRGTARLPCPRPQPDTRSSRAPYTHGLFSSAGLAFRDGAMPCLCGHSQSLARNSNLNSVIKEEKEGTRHQTGLDILSRKER